MAKLKDIKGSAIQYLAEDPVEYVGSWSSGGGLNSAREAAGGLGIQTAALYVGGFPVSPGALVEQYDGSSFTEVADLNTGRGYPAATFGTTTAGIQSGGVTSPTTRVGNTESWNGSAWTEVNDLNTARSQGTGFGTSTAGYAVAGGTPSRVANVESWNGSSWTETTDVNTARYQHAGNGTTTSGLIYGGFDATAITGVTESWNGSAWTEVSDLNSSRQTLAGAGTGNDNGLAFGGNSPSPAYMANTESWDGSSWTEVNDLSTGRTELSGAGPSNTLALAMGGQDGSATPATEEWSFPPITATILQEGQLWFNYTSSALKGFGKAAGIPAATWASGGALNTARRRLLGSGIQTASIAVAGYSTAAQALAEQYNGSSWTEVSDLNTQRDSGGMAGGAPYTATIYFGGGNSPGGNTGASETWDGSSWTEVGDLNTARNLAVGFGASQTAALGAGGETPPVVASTETWDGTSWTEVNNLNTARAFAAGTGPTSVGIVFGGEPPNIANAEKWDGTSWTETGDLNTGRPSLGGSGSQTLALAFGGKSPAVGNTENFNGTSWTEVNDLSTVRGGGPMGVGSAVTAIAAGGNNPGGNLSSTEEWTADNALATVTVS